MLLNCGVGEDSWESLGLQGDPASQSQRKSVLNIHWKDWRSSWNSRTLATWCEGLTHLKRPWCWERLRAGGEGDDRRWTGWMASPTQWARVWVDSRSWWWTGRPGMLRFMRLQRVGHDWATKLDWTEMGYSLWFFLITIQQIKRSFHLFPSCWDNLNYQMLFLYQFKYQCGFCSLIFEMYWTSLVELSNYTRIPGKNEQLIMYLF